MRRLLLPLLLLAVTLAGPASAQERKFVIFFQEWSAALEDAALAVITEAAHLALETNRGIVRVTGFADPNGGRQSNVLLSQLRAQRVVDHLLEEGLHASRVAQSGRGPVKFAILAQESRRVEIVVPTR